jgi:hypothetical protein
VCVDLCAVFRLVVLLLCVICVCLIVVRLPLGRNPFAVKINNNDMTLREWRIIYTYLSSS